MPSVMTPAAPASRGAPVAHMPAATLSAASGFSVVGNVIEDAGGHPWFAHGLDRPSLEWACAGQHADGGPAGIPASDFTTMAGAWHANTVRLALNQDYWLSATGTQVAAAENCPGYIDTVRSVVASAESAGLVVILDLHWSDEGNPLNPSVGQKCMADQDSLAFWKSVAATYGSDSHVMFELYNEPHDIPWSVWRDGGTVACNDGVTYTAVGMQQMVDAIRGAGAPNVVVAGGNGWAYDLSGVVGVGALTGGNVAYATHPYENSAGDTPAAWDRAFGSLAAHAPVIATEFGTTTCSVDAYDSDILSYFRSHGVSYTMWAWYVGGCAFPSVISDASGTCTLGGCTTQQDLGAYASGAQQPVVQPYVPFTGSSNPAPGHYVPLDPARVLDTRGAPDGPIGRCAGGGTTLRAGETRDEQVGGAGGVPASGVSAVVLNVTVTNATAGGFLTVFPTGAPRPTASNLNFGAGQTVANLVQVAIGAGGEVSMFNPSGTVDVIADVEGYVAPSSTSAGLFNPLAPARLCDTRAAGPDAPANQCSGATVLGGHTLSVQVAGHQGVPATGVAAVVLNVTATDATAPSYLTVFPGDAARPLASNLNFLGGQTVPNRVVVRVGSGGDVAVFNAAGAADVVVDVAGWYTDASAATGAVDQPLAPARICDTRSVAPGIDANQCTGSTLGPGGTLRVLVAGNGGVPAMSSSTPPAAVVLNVTATGTTAPAYLTAYPSGSQRPLASDLNWAAGVCVANLVVVAVGPDGRVMLFNSAGSTDVVVDVEGWYRA